MKRLFPCAAAAEEAMKIDWIPFVLLAIGANQDRKERKVDVWDVILLAAAGILVRVIRKEMSPWILADVLPGAILILFSFASRGEIGMGDGLILAALGLSRGFWYTVAEAFLALVLFTCWGILQILRRKRTMRTPAAYLPFLFLADGILLLCW